MKNRLVYSEFGDNGDNNDAIARPTPERPPQEQQLRVQATRKGRKGKTVTVVSGFQSRPDTLKALLKSLKRQCGAGGSVKENSLEIQGDVVERVVALLIEAGYPAKRSGG